MAPHFYEPNEKHCRTRFIMNAVMNLIPRGSNSQLLRPPAPGGGSGAGLLTEPSNEVVGVENADALADLLDGDLFGQEGHGTLEPDTVAQLAEGEAALGAEEAIEVVVLVAGELRDVLERDVGAIARLEEA